MSLVSKTPLTVPAKEIVIAEEVEIANRWWARFRGLQFRSALPAGRALFLVPCPSIHTFWMRFAIDVLFLNREGIIVDIRKNLKPWRICLPESTSFAVIEVTAGQLPTELVIGDQVELPAELADK